MNPMPRNSIRAVVAVVVCLGASASAVDAQQVSSAGLMGLDRDVACAPSSPLTRPLESLKVVSGREIRKTLFGIGDALVVSGGTAQGVRAGDEYFVRRIVPDRFVDPVDGAAPISIHTAGTVRIVEARGDVAIAVITLGCDGVLEGDFLERYQAPVIPADSGGTAPDFDAPARLLLGAERRQIGASGDFMVLDRGSDHGVRPGQALTIFRTTPAGPAAPVTTIGTATVYVVQPKSSTVRIERSVDAVYVGDLVAIHR
jgi:hypothetical protein